MASAVIRIPESSVESYLDKIERAQVDVEACIRLMNAEGKSHNHPSMLLLTFV